MSQLSPDFRSNPLSENATAQVRVARCAEDSACIRPACVSVNTHSGPRRVCAFHFDLLYDISAITARSVVHGGSRAERTAL